MDGHIKIYTDGSFKKNKAGISFLIINPDRNKILGYTNLKCKKNIQAELHAYFGHICCKIKIPNVANAKSRKLQVEIP